MAVVTWNGSSSTDFATAANWDTGSVPTASDDVIIPDTSSINKCVLDQARNINSFVLAADGEFDGGNTLFIKGKNAAGEAIKAQGKLGDVTDFNLQSLNGGSCVLNLLAVKFPALAFTNKGATTLPIVNFPAFCKPSDACLVKGATTLLPSNSCTGLTIAVLIPFAPNCAAPKPNLLDKNGDNPYL